MTEQEREAIAVLSGDVKQLTTESTALRIVVERHMASEEVCRRDVKALHAEVFGVDGDRQRPGLKGRMRDVEGVVENYKAGVSRVWLVVVAIVGALGGALGKAFLLRISP